MGQSSTPVIYTIGIDRLTQRALQADLPGARLRSLPPGRERHGPAPALVLLDLQATDPTAERRSLRAAWGDRMPVVGVDRRQPMARLWHAESRLIDVEPGFLAPFVPAAALQSRPGARTSREDIEAISPSQAGRIALYLGVLASAAFISEELGMLLSLYLLAVVVPLFVHERRLLVR